MDGGLEALWTPVTLRRPPDVPPEQEPAEYRYHPYRGEGGKQAPRRPTPGCQLDADQHSQRCPDETAQQGSGDTPLMVDAGVEGDGPQQAEPGHDGSDGDGIQSHQILPVSKDYADASDQAPNRKADHTPEEPDEHGSAEQAGSAINGKDNIAALLARNDATQRTEYRRTNDPASKASQWNGDRTRQSPHQVCPLASWDASLLGVELLLRQIIPVLQGCQAL